MPPTTSRRSVTNNPFPLPLTTTRPLLSTTSTRQPRLVVFPTTKNPNLIAWPTKKQPPFVMTTTSKRPSTPTTFWDAWSPDNQVEIIPNADNQLTHNHELSTDSNQSLNPKPTQPNANLVVDPWLLQILDEAQRNQTIISSSGGGSNALRYTNLHAMSISSVNKKTIKVH